MHQSDPAPLPDIETGLSVVRWKACGFKQMVRSGLLDPKLEFELVDGLVLHRSARSRDHDLVVNELADRLRSAHDDLPFTEVAVGHELCLKELEAVLKPDIAVLSGGEVPVLVVEVSDAPARVDAMDKARLYARAGVELYWLIEIGWGTFHVHVRPHGPDYGLRASGPPWQPSQTWLPAMPELTLNELFDAVGCPVARDMRGPA